VSIFNVPLFAFFTVLTVVVLMAGLRRLVGMTLSPLRTVIAALIVFFSASPIITAMAGSSVSGKHPNLLPGLWFVFLGVAVAILVGMVFLVIAEALVPSGSLPGPLFVVRSTRQLVGRARRYSQISRILARHGLLPYLRGGRRSELATAEGRERLARSLRLALEDGGVTFVKLGQLLSTRRDLLPPEFIGELSHLQDDAPKLPWSAVNAVLEAALGDPVAKKFATFAEEPIAAASIAQVHTATLPSGEQVVVKVRRPDISGVVSSDLDIVQRLARRLERGTRWGRSVGAVQLAQGFAAALHEELDLRIEARNMTAVASATATRGKGVRVPTPYRPYCGQQVLVMQFLDGRPLLGASAGLPAEAQAALARRLLDSLLSQVMLDGIFHADPHPGNILLLEDGDLGLLDWGSVGRIDAVLRADLQRLLMALDRGDPIMLTDALLDVMDRPEQLEEAKLQRALGRYLAQHLVAGAGTDVRMFTELFRIVADYELAVPPEIAAVFRALATMEGTLTQLAPGFDIVVEARRFGEQQVTDRLSPDAISKAAAGELAALVPMLRRLPRRIDRIGAALEEGRLTVSVRLLADPSDRQYLAGLVHRVLLAFLSASAGIMGVLMVGLRGGPVLSPHVSLYSFFGYCLLVIAAIMALRVLARVFRSDRG